MSHENSPVCGDQIVNSAEISQLIQSLAAEVTAINQKVSEVRPPKSEWEGRLQKSVEEIGNNRGRPLFYPYVGSGSGHGCKVELQDGSVKLDLINGIGIHILGHGHPRLLEASLRGALSDIVMQGNLQMNGEYQKFAGKILSIAKKGSRLEHVWITTSGSMANEIALKISRQKHTPARKIVAMKDAFAGRTTMMTEVGDNPSHSVGQPAYGEVLRVPFYDKNDPQSAEKSLRALKEHVAQNEGNISIFGFEPVQGEGGFKTAPREFFLPMLDFCKERGIAVWLDEIQTFSRTGEFFAFQYLDIGQYADIVTFAKTAQVAGTLYTAEYNPQAGLIAGTFAGTSVALAAGYEVLDVLESGGYMGSNGRIQQIHKKFVSVLNSLIEGSCKGLLDDAGGVGLMVAVTPFGGDKDKVGNLLKVLYKNGMIAFSCGRGSLRLRFLVPAVITDEEIELAGRILEKSILEVK